MVNGLILVPSPALNITAFNQIPPMKIVLYLSMKNFYSKNLELNKIFNFI